VPRPNYDRRRAEISKFQVTFKLALARVATLDLASLLHPPSPYNLPVRRSLLSAELYTADKRYPFVSRALPGEDPAADARPDVELESLRAPPE
jgi:hypothetical protein